MNRINLYIEQTNKGGISKDGFYGYIFVPGSGNKSKRKEGFQSICDATGNKTELIAITEALKRLTKPCEVTIYSAKGSYKVPLTKWVRKWEENNWKNAKGEIVANKKEWIELLAETKKHSVITGPTKEHEYSKYMIKEMEEMEEIKNGII